MEGGAHMPSIVVMFNNEKVLDQSLTRDVYVIGRHEDCEIHIDNLGISRAHARLLKEGDQYFVEDMKSSNGTFLNGEQIQKQALKDGDQVVIGKYVITYSAGGEAAAPTGESAEQTEQKAGAVVEPGDVLHTMAMDGDAIRKRIEEMQKQKGKDTAPLPAVSDEQVKGKKDSITQAELRARDAEMGQIRSHMQRLKIVIVLVLLAIFIGVLYVLFWMPSS